MSDLTPHEDWALGMMFGLAIGDALGAPIEFQPSREPEDYIRSYMTGGAHNVSKGEFTDDTSMALAMADAIIDNAGFNPNAIMDNFLKWKNEGAYAPRGVMFDCGNTVHSALTAYEADNTNPYTGPTDSMSAGNGGLMRLAPAIIGAGCFTEAIHWAEESTRLTHGADEALLYSKLLAEELWSRTPLKKNSGYKHPSTVVRSEVMSGGYVKETYQAAWWAFQTTTNFEDCIIEAINRGHDSDTTGAVAGMIAGAIYGFDAIPNWMIEGLQWGRQIREYTIGLLQVANKATLREELQRVSESLLDIQDPEAGKTYEVAGHSCLCIHPLASYGGGAATLWAVEGHSAQLTLAGRMDGYIRGKCIRIIEERSVIIFDPLDASKPSMHLAVDDIARYDTNWL
jgi:ADP-ribosyl-[dinitrogen reductase] hydrolase